MPCPARVYAGLSKLGLEKAEERIEKDPDRRDPVYFSDDRGAYGRNRPVGDVCPVSDPLCDRRAAGLVECGTRHRTRTDF